MKRLIAFLSVLLSMPAFADGFGVNDKVLFFSTDVLIEVIERNFDKSLQLGVANKYTELMDATTHSVSIADLISVCGVGNLDREKCRNFINDLLTTMDIGDTVKPFYWADYIPYRGDEPSNTFVPHMGFEQDTGIWTIRFPWMKEQSFQKQYPGVEHLGGISACTAESGTVHVADTSKKFAQNEQTGSNCWCKMTFPEESAWVYHTSMDSVTISTGKTTDSDTMCNRGCALECLSAVRGADESMRAAMFTAVKLNGANEPGPIDPEEFKKKFKKCEFDWRTEAFEEDLWGGGALLTQESDNTTWIGYKTQKNLYEMPEKVKLYNYLNEKSKDLQLKLKYPSSPWPRELNSKGLKYEEWARGGFSWMKSDNFQCKYPGVKKIKGVATCNNVKGDFGQVTNRNFTPNEKTGLYCWCKVTYPEQSKWYCGYPFEKLWSHDLTEDWIVKKTTTQGDVVVGYEAHTEKQKMSQEEIEMRIKADISDCDAFCLIHCAQVIEFKAMPVKR